MAFSQGKRPLRVLIASRLASTTTELEEWLVNARVLAGGIHGQRLEAPFDGHVIELQEELEFARVTELVLALQEVLLRLLLHMQKLHLFKFARIFHHRVLDLIMAFSKLLSVPFVIFFDYF